MDPITLNSINNIKPFELKPKSEEAISNSDKSSNFHETIKSFIDDVNSSQQNADHAVEQLVFGEKSDIADTVIALEKAKISFQLMVNIRNTLLQSYQEIMRMQI
ncbi:MAG: flagellar hook-basal body complex protein FliE [Candidatus Firestonebacteria bacterium]|nr:flagellar hook-basal body complex protein FliE [Candidatus Firestonebacteria bacterium]